MTLEGGGRTPMCRPERKALASANPIAYLGSRGPRLRPTPPWGGVSHRESERRLLRMATSRVRPSLRGVLLLLQH